MNRSLMSLVTGICATLLCTAASAREAGDWIGRLGVHYVDPKSDNHEVVSVEGAVSVTGGLTYFATPTLAIDLLVAVPFEHDIELEADGRKVGSTQHLPPTLSLAWFPETSMPIKPFVGVGLNYTLFFEEDTKGALAGSKLELDESFGPAFMAGILYEFTPGLSLMVDVRHFDIDTEAHLDGTSLGDVHIDPWAFGASVAYEF